MPSTNLWAANSQGKVFVLSTRSGHWRGLHHDAVEFKRLSAINDCAWGIGSDHRVYVYIPIRDIPIRFREISYENQRWIPNSFGSKLLPTDRPHFSNAEGTKNLPKEGFILSSPSWQWETDWYIEDNLEGQPLETEGWTYAVDFPFTYEPNKRWKSMVRRRKWVRYRRFTAMDNWSLIPSVHSDPVKEPFIDIAIGGTEIPGGSSDVFSVWAVTILGRVMYRYGVTSQCPEGEGWVNIPVPNKQEVSQISVGPTGHVWAVSWDGSALVRKGISREKINGSGWDSVPPPSEDHPLVNLAVGSNVVWAVSKYGKVWFRKGFDNVKPLGTGWVEMFGEMSMISMAADDQVLGLGKDNIVHIRTGVTSSELSGKTWKPLSVRSKALTLSHKSSHSSYSSLSLDENQSQASSSPKAIHHSLTPKSNISLTPPNSIKSLGCTPSAIKFSESPQFNDKSNSLSDLDNRASFLQNEVFQTQESVNSTHTHDSIDSHDSTHTSDTLTDSVIDPGTELVLEEPGQEEGSIVSREDRVLGSIIQYTDSDGNSIPYLPVLPREVWPNEMEDHIPVEDQWMWIAAGGCHIEPNTLPHKWFSSPSGSNSDWEDEPFRSHKEPWRKQILEKFKQRFTLQVKPFLSYPSAIDKSGWVKTNNCQTWNSKHSKWQDAVLELETHERESVDGSSLSLRPFSSTFKNTTLRLQEVVCTIRLKQNNKHILSIFSRSLKQPIKITFSSENYLDDWLSTLNVTCCSEQSIMGKPISGAVLATTKMGLVYVSNPPQDNTSSPSFWYLLGGGHLYQIVTAASGVIWALGYNNVAWVYTGGYGGGPFKGIPGHNIEICPMNDTKCIYVYENQRWNPLTGFSNRGFPTDRYMWSDRTGRIECTKNDAQLPSSNWQWDSNWEVDFKTPGDVDNEGWQYAPDFPMSYHPSKNFTDYVRRRRWKRKCKILTQGPWEEIGRTPLISLAIRDQDGYIGAWAVSTDGYVLLRQDVTPDSPQGSGWLHVATEQPCKSITVGFQVWAVAADGSAFLRNEICRSRPMGESWFHVEAPHPGMPLKYIFAGGSSVFGLAINNSLWYRQEIGPYFPEGTCWKHVSDNVHMVSVSSDDEVWAICDLPHDSNHEITSKVLCKRTGVTSENKMGTGWNIVLSGGCWQWVTAG